MKILFITHDFSRTGAPIVLLNFMKWLKKNSSIQFTLISAINKGSLRSEFEDLCSVYYWNDKKRSQSLRNKVKARISEPARKKRLLLSLRKESYSHIYANTIASAKLSVELKRSITSSPKLIVHLHELKVIIDSILPELSELDQNIDNYIAASDLVKDQLVNLWNISENKIFRVYECSTVNHHRSDHNSTDVFTIGGSGHVHWRKGTDLFLQVAGYISRHSQKRVKYKWVGEINKLQRSIMEEDARKLGIAENIVFTGSVDAPDEIFADFDVFLMTSREDPFPLVCIEVGMMGIPIICFKDATGTEEILVNGGGRVVPYLNIEAMGDAVIHYIENRDSRFADGNEASELFSNFKPEIICPQLLQIVEKIR